MDCPLQPDYKYPGKHCQRVGLTKRLLLDFLSNDVDTHIPEIALTDAIVWSSPLSKRKKRLAGHQLRVGWHVCAPSMMKAE